jgi:hypothetical protein
MFWFVRFSRLLVSFTFLFCWFCFITFTLSSSSEQLMSDTFSWLNGLAN